MKTHENGSKSTQNNAFFALFSAFLLVGVISALLQWQKRYIETSVQRVIRVAKTDLTHLIEARVSRMWVENTLASAEETE